MKIERDKFVPAVGLMTEELARFQNSGQVEVSSFALRYLYVGEIRYAVVEGWQLRIGFVWVLSGRGFPPTPKEWVMDSNRNSYVIDLKDYQVANIGPGMEGGGDRMWIHSKFESLMFYPPDGKKFDSARSQELLAKPARKFPATTGIEFFVD